MTKYRVGLEGRSEPGIVPVTAELIAMLRRQHADVTLDGMVLPVAQEIVSEWRVARDYISKRLITLSSVKIYTKTVRTLLARYEKKIGLDRGEISPMQVVYELFEHAYQLQPASWTSYRSAFIWHFDSILVDYSTKELPTDSYYKALAILIVVNKKPWDDTRPLEAKPPKRPASMKQEHFKALINRLAIRKGLPIKAQSFAIATLTTGIRPGEWRDVTIRPALSEDMTIPQTEEENHQDWFVLDIATSKQKAGAPDRRRTLLIRRGTEKSQIVQHMAYVAEVLTVDPTTRKMDPMDAFIKRVSSLIAARCKEIWPNHPNRWATLYSLRGQARSNFSFQFGDEIAGEMMGHDADVGRKFYTARRQGFKPTTSASVLPGRDVTARAKAEIDRKRFLNASEMQPWRAGSALAEVVADTEGT